MKDTQVIFQKKRKKKAFSPMIKPSLNATTCQLLADNNTTDLYSLWKMLLTYITE